MDYADLADAEVSNYISACARENDPKKTKTRVLQPEGHCHYCYEDVGDNKLFCDQTCAEKYDTQQRMRRS